MTDSLPPAPTLTFVWRAPASRQILGRNNLLKIAFLQAGILAATSVVRVVVPGQWYGSGFLVAPDLVLTNHHVLPDGNTAQVAQLQFNYEVDLAGNPRTVETYTLLPNDLYKTNVDLDYALVRVNGTPGQKYGFLALRGYDTTVAVDDPVNIIQHPRARYKELAVQDNPVQHVDDKFIQYLTDTEPGSSGSPVFNNQWQVVGIHHASVPDPNNSGVYTANEAVSMRAILTDAGAVIP